MEGHPLMTAAEAEGEIKGDPHHLLTINEIPSPTILTLTSVLLRNSRIQTKAIMLDRLNLGSMGITLGVHLPPSRTSSVGARHLRRPVGLATGMVNRVRVSRASTSNSAGRMGNTILGITANMIPGIMATDMMIDVMMIIGMGTHTEGARGEDGMMGDVLTRITTPGTAGRLRESCGLTF
jgi:hypothetical protein